MKNNTDWKELKLDEVFERHMDCMLEKSQPWEIKERGWATNGMGDMIVNNAKFAVILQDWELLLQNMMLLKQYKRWPDWLEPGRKNRKGFKARGYKGFRGQRSMTLDPYLQTLCALAMVEDGPTLAWVQTIKIPFWISWPRPWLHRFKKTLENTHSKRRQRRFEKAMMRNFKFREMLQPMRLRWIDKKQKHKEAGNRFRAYIYGRLQNNLGNPGYVKFEFAWMAYVTQSKKVQEAIARVTPHWNYGVLLLCEKPTMYLAKDFIENYQAKDGFQWSSDNLVTDKNRIIPPGQEYQLDKQFLDYLWNKYKLKRKCK